MQIFPKPEFFLVHGTDFQQTSKLEMILICIFIRLFAFSKHLSDNVYSKHSWCILDFIKKTIFVFTSKQIVILKNCFIKFLKHCLKDFQDKVSTLVPSIQFEMYDVNNTRSVHRFPWSWAHILHSPRGVHS